MIKISMLLPARARPANLKSSVQSVLDLAHKPDEVEILVRLDADDPHLRQEMQILQEPSAEILVDVGPRYGYAHMHRYYSELAAQARGEWLFIWNDDTDMVTRGWDSLTLDCPLFSVQFPRRDTTPTTDYTFPVIGRPVFNALGGRVSENAYCDAWLSDVSGFAGTSIIRDDVVFHHHRLNDDTLREQANGNAEWMKFTADDQKAMRIKAMEKIMAAPGWRGRFDEWHVRKVEHIGVDYINLLAGERRACAYQLLGRK